MSSSITATATSMLSAVSSATVSSLPSAAAAAPTDDPYYLLYMGVQATIPFALRNMAVQVALSSVVFTLYLILVSVSHARQRRTWTFALASLVFALFFVTAFTNSIQLAHALQNPAHKVDMGIEFGDVVLTLCLPWIGDWLVWLRMISLWPKEHRGRAEYMVMFGAPVVLKIFRLGILCALLDKLYHQMLTSMNAADLYSKVWPLSWLTWTEYGAMLVDVSICSAICIARLTALMTPSHSERRSFALQSRLRLLLTNTVSSFILPVISAVVMVILGAGTNFDPYATWCKVNAGITAINVLIAIIIPTIQHKSNEEQGGSADNHTNSFMRNKMRSGRGSAADNGAARQGPPAASAGHAHSRAHNGVMQTTLEESFVDHLEYGVQVCSPDFSQTQSSEKKSPMDETYEQDGLEMKVPGNRPRNLSNLSATTMMTTAVPPIPTIECGGHSPQAGSRLAPGSNGLAIRPYASSTDLERRPHRHTSSQNQELDPYHHTTTVTGAPLNDDDTRDVLRTMPRLSRFGQ
ncbi:unnamed protein product [Tilletia controversa]|uniref:Uncharacterized protein n=1 Tax=Tilletia controversa TaxID=13291 RepID=A0A8X7MUA4_9BASI|nr:hypothetical protein CF328_g403 [Tilletia controversa]KAE8248745.1 hypothetical protein A4X06_0g3541 [Tilletia controversa]CAD6919090.1 unnamed protein product [Tilletia controversa]CAD6944136.1 unnamed protein product [Tilletia controversa]